MEAATYPAGEFQVSQEEIDADGDPDLCHHGIAGGTHEAFDLQILLDPFEKQLDLPAGLVDVGNGRGGEIEVVGQKVILLAGFGILETDPAQHDRAVAGLGASQANGLIARQALRFEHATAFDDSIPGIFA